ncbi:MAG: DUF3971 domain-containing protein [Sneathiella sp.]
MLKAASKILVRTVLSIFVLVVLSGMALVAALSRGPLTVSFAAPYISQVLTSQYPEIDLKFNELNLMWDGDDKRFVFGVTDVSVRRGADPIAVIPAVTVTVSRDALLEGRVAVSGLEFTGLKVLLTRSENGKINFGFSYKQENEAETETEGETSSASSSAATVAMVQTLIEDIVRRKNTSDLATYLDRVEIYQSGLFVEDVKTDKIWRVTSANIVLWRSDKGLVGRIQGDAHIGDKTINLVANAAYDSRDRTTVINTKISDFPLSLIGEEVAEAEILNGIDLPISGDINIFLDKEFLPVQVGFNLTADEGSVDIPTLYKKPVPINSISIEGHTAAPFEALNINSLFVHTRDYKISMSGSLLNGVDGFGLSVEGSLPEFKTDDLSLYWPYSAAVDGYKWVTTNIKDGLAKDATFRVDIPPGALETGKIPEGAVEVKFSFEGFSTDYFAPLPKVTGISGKAIMTEKQIHVFDMSGTLGTMDVPEGDALIYDFDMPRQHADITLKVTGDNQKIFEFLDREPLGMVSPYGIVPSHMKGEGVVNAHFVFPLKDDLTFEQVQFEVKGEFSNATIPNFYEDLDLTEGTLSVSVVPEKLVVRGPVKINKVPTEISFFSWFRGEKAGVRRYEASTKLDDEDRVALGIETEFLKGPVSISIGFDEQEDGSSAGVLTMNLLEATLEIPDLKIEKPIGVTGLIGAQFTSDGKGNQKVSNIRLSSDSIRGVGEMTLDEEGIATFDAPSIVYGENNLSASLVRNAPDDYSITVQGSVLDLKPYIVGSYSLNEGKAEKNEKPLTLRVTVAVDSVLLDGGVSLKEAEGFVHSVDGAVLQGKLKARFSEKFGVTYVVSKSKKGRHLEFKSDHAGLLLRGMDTYDNVREGKLVITAEIDDTKEESVATGYARMTDIRVVDAPVLGSILTLGSLGGIVDLMRNEGMTFATVEGPFTYENGLLSTEGFRAVGSIGITVTGKLDQKSGEFDAFGTVIPSYTLNSMLGNIPILGRLLVGRKGEGIFGFSYKAKGTKDNPDVSVNPVSALAPGILRRMFFEPWGNNAKGSGDKTGVELIEKDDKP